MTTARSPIRSRDVVLAAALVGLVLAVYAPTLGHGFIWDDDAYVQHNLTLRSADGLRRIWTEPGAVPQYYPLVHTTFWLEFQAWELDARGYHAVNLGLHAVSALLLWVLLARLGLPGAWLGAALFAVHPVGVESVAWITERKNVLSGALAFGSLLAYLRFDPLDSEPTHDRNARAWALALLLYVAALLSKTVTASVPAVFLVLMWWKRGRITRRDVLPLLPFFAVGLALAWVTVWMERVFVGAAGEDWSFTAIERVLIAGRALWFYAGKLAWPDPLIFFYPRWSIDAGAAWQYAFPAAAIAVAAAMWFARRRIGRGPLAAACIFAGVLVPALGFFDVYPFRFSFVADHFQYHASAALFALAAAAAAAARDRLPAAHRWIGPLVAAFVVVALAGVAYRRTAPYASLTALYQDTIAQNPEAWAAHHNLGYCLEDEKRYAEALVHFREAVRLNPGHARLRNSLGGALFRVGALDEAESEIRAALAGNLGKRDRADARVHLGNVLVTRGRLDEALAEYRAALAIRPDFALGLYDYGVALARGGDRAAAIAQIRRSLEIDPGYADASYALGSLLVEEGRSAEAIAPLADAARLEPKNAKYRRDLGAALLRGGDPARAAIELAAAIEIEPEHAIAHNLLGVSLAQQGELARAAREFETALALDPQLASAAGNLEQARAATRAPAPAAP